MLFLVPGNPGESFWVIDRMKYGLLPTLSGVLLLALAGILWSRATARKVESTINRALIGGVAIVGIFWVVLIVIANFEHRIP